MIRCSNVPVRICHLTKCFVVDIFSNTLKTRGKNCTSSPHNSYPNRKNTKTKREVPRVGEPTSNRSPERKEFGYSSPPLCPTNSLAFYWRGGINSWGDTENPESVCEPSSVMWTRECSSTMNRRRRSVESLRGHWLLLALFRSRVSEGTDRNTMEDFSHYTIKYLFV